MTACDRHLRHHGLDPVLEDDVVALCRLIDYATDEALKQGLFNCARTLRAARDQISHEAETRFDVVPAPLSAQNVLPP